MGRSGGAARRQEGYPPGVLGPGPSLVALAGAAILAASAGAAPMGGRRPPVPVPRAPAPGAKVQALPPFAWRGAAGADRYEFQIAADPGFRSPVLGPGRDRFMTRNTWATVDEAVPNGAYWWRVRTVTEAGAVSPWSSPRPVRKRWSWRPRLLAPAQGAEIRFPAPLVLRWSGVPFAARYLVALASDRDLGTLVGGRLIETEGLSYAPSVTLPVGTYYWAVTPVDAQGNRGARSRVSSFRWAWRSETRLAVRDLVAAPEHFDPQLSWRPVPGAARYEVEINPTRDWAAGSKVCCREPLVTTTFSPTQLLGNNRYYWRLRAISVDGNAGRWNEGPPFTKVFDNVEGSRPPLRPPSIKNLRVRDNAADGGPRPPGWTTSAPVVVWDPVPGASSYQVDVALFHTRDRPGDCDWTARLWEVDTAVPAWTPQAYARARREPYPVRTLRPSSDGVRLLPGQAYCVRVRARTDRDGQGRQVFGDYAYFPDPGGHQPAFTFAGYAAGSGSPSMRPEDYAAPVGRVRVTRTPLFTWRAIPGAAAYWVLVSKDASFTNVVDYALTNIPAYAPRRGHQPVTYPDEETLYYWAVLPARSPDGSGAAGDPLAQSPQSFRKLSRPPRFLLPRQGSLVVGPPTFRWTPAEGALRYRLQVSTDRNFGSLLDEVLTAATAYTATQTYPANAALYARVRAEDENEIGLTWSAPRSFRNTLPRPRPSGDNPARGDLIPTWTWKPAQGAVSYDVHVELPDGSDRDVSGYLPSAFTATEMRGTGIFHWQVRAEFPAAGGGKTAVGPYSRRLAFTRTLGPPTGARVVISPRSLLLRWKPKIGIGRYRVEIARTPDFSRLVEQGDTEAAAFAPRLRGSEWDHPATLYWRVAAVDGSGNVGRATPTRAFRWPGLRPGRRPRS